MAAGGCHHRLGDMGADSWAHMAAAIQNIKIAIDFIGKVPWARVF